MKKKATLKILFFIFILLSVTFFMKWNSQLNRNTRDLEKKLSASDAQVSGKTVELFNFDYDVLYVFEPYESKEEMETKIGFRTSILQETVSEGMMNILFVKENSPVAYLYGYLSNTGYFIEIPPGKYRKDELDLVQYNKSIGDVGNSYGTPITFIRYIFEM
jgi:hypothetical protein